MFNTQQHLLLGCKKSNWTRTIAAYAFKPFSKEKKTTDTGPCTKVFPYQSRCALIKIPTKEIRNRMTKACVRKESCFGAKKKRLVNSRSALQAPVILSGNSRPTKRQVEWNN